MEIIKDRIYNPDRRGKESRLSAQIGVYYGILGVLKMMAPIMPHITEEVYQLYFADKEKCKSVHNSEWPKFEKKMVDAEAEETGDLAVDIINLVRKYKSEQKMSLKDELAEVILVSDKENFQKHIKSLEEDLKAVIRAKKISFSGDTSLETEQFKVKVGIRN